MQKLFLILAVSVAASGCVQVEDSKVNHLRVTDRVTLAGYPDAPMIADLKASDALVIDLRRPQEMNAQAPSLEQHQLQPVNIPLGGNPPRRTDVDRFERLLSEAGERPVVIYCTSGNRAGLLWAAMRIDRGVPVEDAIREVSDVATRTDTVRAIRAYADREQAVE